EGGVCCYKVARGKQSDWRFYRIRKAAETLLVKILAFSGRVTFGQRALADKMFLSPVAKGGKTPEKSSWRQRRRGRRLLLQGCQGKAI
ncbi:hypothetical protein VS884_25595, partial [Escherichia coli]